MRRKITANAEDLPDVHDIDCFLAGDDATFQWRAFRTRASMAEKSLEERVRAIEVQLAGKTLEEHFREQAELIDQRFAEHDKKWERRFHGLERSVSALSVDVSTLKADVRTLKADAGLLKTDTVSVREGIGMLLKERR